MKNRKFTAFLFALVGLLHFTAAVSADLIGINFRRDSGVAALSSGDIAGVVPQANWNNADGVILGTTANVNGGNVVDELGVTVAGLTVDWTSPGTWSLANGATSDGAMMSGYLDMTGNGLNQIITLSIANIPYANYDVYIYHDSSGGANRTARYQANGTDVFTRNHANGFSTVGYVIDQHATLLDSNNSANGGNVVLFSGLSGSTLSIEGQGIGAADGGFAGSDNTRRGPIQGIQIVQRIPEPSSLVLVACGFCLVIRNMRCRR